MASCGNVSSLVQIMRKRHVAVAALAWLSASASASTFVPTAGGTYNWGDSANWSGGVPDAPGATADFTSNIAGNVAVDLQSAADVNDVYTVGSLTFQDLLVANQNLTLQNGTLDLATLDATTPSIANATPASGTTNGLLILGTAAAPLSITGTQGVTFGAGGVTNGAGVAGPHVRFGNGLNWSGFAGTVTLASGAYDPQSGNTAAGNVLPQDERIVLGTDARVAYLNVQAGRNQTFLALDGNAQSFVLNSGATATTLTVGNLNGSGTFAGRIGTNGSAPSPLGVNLTKIGGGVQTYSGNIASAALAGAGAINANGGTLILSGANSYAGQTTVNNGGLLLMNGVHTAPAAASGLGTNIGNYLVAVGGTLGGEGTIRPFVDNATGGGVLVSVRGTLNPGNAGGDVGTLTLDGINAVKSMLIAESTGTFAFDVGNGAGNLDSIAVVNSQGGGSPDVRFVNGSTVAINDLTGGTLASGSYLLIDTDFATNAVFGGLTIAADGTVTGGVSLAGVSAYGTGASLRAANGDLFLNIAAVPEPGTLGAALGLSALVLRRRRPLRADRRPAVA